MAYPSPRPRSRTILYVATTPEQARDGAAALEAVATEAESELDGRELAVEPITSVDRLPDLAPDADCVVVRETSAVEGPSLLEVVTACGTTPLVLFTSASYASAITRSAEGIDGYVRRDTDDAVVHLADEIDKVCHGSAIDELTGHDRSRDRDHEPDSTTESERADRQPETDAAGDEPESDPVEPDIDTDTQLEELSVGSGSVPDPNPDSESESEPEVTANPESESEPEATANPGPDVEPDPETDSEPESNAESATEPESNDEPTTEPKPQEKPETTPITGRETDSRTATALLETTSRIVDCRDRELLFGRVVEGAVGVLGFQHCWLSTVHFGELVPRAAAPAVPESALESTSVDGPLGEAFRTGEPRVIDDLTDADVDPDPPFDTARSLCSVPVGDIGVLRTAAETPNAFDETDVDLLEGLCNAAAAVLERNWDEMGVVNERNRLEREVDRLERERDQLAAATEQLANERDRIAAERDQLLGLVEDIGKPTIRYAVTDGRAVIRDVNEAVTTVFGDDRETVVGTPVDEYVVPDGLEERAATLSEALREDEQYQLLDQRETVEGTRDFMLSIVPLERAADAAATSDHDHEGLLVYEDITESKRRELELAAATERLERIAELLEDGVDEPLSTARNYLAMAEKSGDEGQGQGHLETIDEAHERLREQLAEIENVAAWDDDSAATEPIAIQDVAQRAWTEIDTGDAQLVTEDDLILEADRERLHELFEYVFRTAIEIDDGDGDGAETEEDDKLARDRTNTPVTITVGATDDGFYVAGDRPAASDDGDGRQEAPTPTRLTASDGSGLQLGLVERIAEEHGWDVGVAEDEDGSAFAFRGVDAISVNRNRV